MICNMINGNIDMNRVFFLTEASNWGEKLISFYDLKYKKLMIKSM